MLLWAIGSKHVVHTYFNAAWRLGLSVMGLTSLSGARVLLRQSKVNDSFVPPT
jgi:hypothetical protein